MIFKSFCEWYAVYTQQCRNESVTSISQQYHKPFKKNGNRRRGAFATSPLHLISQDIRIFISIDLNPKCIMECTAPYSTNNGTVNVYVCSLIQALWNFPFICEDIRIKCYTFFTQLIWRSCHNVLLTVFTMLCVMFESLHSHINNVE